MAGYIMNRLTANSVIAIKMKHKECEREKKKTKMKKKKEYCYELLHLFA